MDRNATCVLHLGSNAGDKSANIHDALQAIERNIGTVRTSSKLYETEAWGPVDQPSFLNLALTVETSLPPFSILEACQKIEMQLGRVRSENWGPRTIDIDILYFESCIIGTERLTLPHPFIHQRRFVLQPLADLIPNFVHPVLDQTTNQLLEKCQDSLSVKAVSK
ncbi:MAG: 2-amino-4-hydroxy-6-hydroxymethyldihydropteridine diphosphokinase [Bacteroidetes bacterium]|jgi:2-amino-4-hydroxy-6-hydroxymethyldihydropteridine diphosphokinase|nr:2-amino-4-hydroxy-6-hydroxymethyldihydropteridine diphosphokinase [Bacteroidota bacterium]